MKAARFVEPDGKLLWQTPFSAPCALGSASHEFEDELQAEALDAGVQPERLEKSKLIFVNV